MKPEVTDMNNAKKKLPITKTEDLPEMLTDKLFLTPSD
jgi:hypothetical protein